jgi:4-aminobutyrate aminotransferase-like enzyme
MGPTAEPTGASRSATLFEDEQAWIAPGLQTIALRSRLAIARGEGVRLIDEDGRAYLDFNAGVSVASLGHAHPAYVAALTEQLRRCTVGSFTSRARLELVRLIAEIAPGNLRRTQFFSGGAEAVEAAIRLARSFTGRQEIVGFDGCFHGKTAGVLALSDVEWKQRVGPLPGGVHHVPYPDPPRFHGPPGACADASIAALERLLDSRADRVAAAIVEPIQGTAGNVVPPAGFLRRVHTLARARGVLLIADEMITGFGRTGLAFACERDEVVPDILTIGKGMASGFPVSGVVSTDDLVRAEPFALPSASSSSYGGNPLAAAASLVTIRTIVEQGLVENAASVGTFLRDALRALRPHHAILGDVRGEGLLIGMDLVSPGRPTAPLPGQACVRFFHECLRRGLILMGYTSRVRIHPPLILTKADAEEGVAIVDAALSAVEDGLS